jgi:hypothetical protein
MASTPLVPWLATTNREYELYNRVVICIMYHVCREPGNLYDTKAKLHSELLPAQAKRKRASEQFIDKLDRRLLDVEASFQGVEPSSDDGDSDDVDSDEE